MFYLLLPLFIPVTLLWLPFASSNLSLLPLHMLIASFDGVVSCLRTYDVLTPLAPAIEYSLPSLFPASVRQVLAAGAAGHGQSRGTQSRSTARRIHMACWKAVGLVVSSPTHVFSGRAMLAVASTSNIAANPSTNTQSWVGG